MKKNPFFNALGASGYIILLSSLLYYGPKPEHQVDSFLVPALFLSTLVLSAAIMGYFFCYTPLTLYLDGHKKEALDFFLKTVATFALLTALIVFVIFFILPPAPPKL